ncbi:integrase catalytic domain-containing protein [Trichonephila clavipes]|nr:integrase catalytic domain-containing protein [Trichonephila clavipes]
MQYLVASVEPKSKAERLILSFPATAANYPKAVDQLKERFGREDLLVQIYVRDLLTMVMKNAVSEVLSEEKICDSVPKITDEQILNNLRELNIEFSDSFSEDLEIDLLVGSNVLGRILMKKCCELDSGLSVVETKLGNTVIGMQDDVCHIDRNVMTTLSMYVRNFKLTDLWNLESLGISNPTLEESKQNSYEDALNDFQQKLTILHNGRYELQLPWKHDPVNLPDNKGLTWARHEKVIKRAESNGFLREYQKVFEDWENLGIIEIVPEEEVKAVKCHYLAHRPVIKLQSETTKYRPCFDGSACENGLSADIEKAFLMLSVHPKDRDYLRFFYPSKEELVYRHCRIVFGLNSSPFLLNASIKHLLDNAPLEYCNVVEKLKSSFYVDNCLSGVNNVKEQENFIDIASKLLSKGCFNLRGWWERLVRVIKELLKRTLGKAILTYEELLTVLCDCEAVVNSRPLTYVSEDPNDLIPLTPSLFLNGKSSYDTVDLDLSEFSKFQKRIKYRRKLIHDFRSRFRKEYLGQLRQKRPGKPGHDFKVGDVVMIEEPSKKRVYWPLGKVISLLPGRDGKVRTLKLKCKNSELIRPIQRVYPLEVPFINNEIVKIDGVPTSSVNEDKLTSNAVIKNKVTRSGRLLKIPERLGLFNEVLYAFE